MVIGADTPNVALYEDGQVIFVRLVKRHYEYFQTQLDKPTLDQILQKLKAIGVVKGHYDIAPGVTDQPEALFYWRMGTSTLATRVYGLTRSGRLSGPRTTMPGNKQATPPPQELLNLHRWLCTLDFPHAKSWTSRYTEVMLGDFSSARKSIPWPGSLPGLNSLQTIKRRDAYSIFLEPQQLPALEKLLSKLTERTAVILSGKKFSLGTRKTFPCEPEWREAFKKL